AGAANPTDTAHPTGVTAPPRGHAIHRLARPGARAERAAGGAVTRRRGPAAAVGGPPARPPGLGRRHGPAVGAPAAAGQPARRPPPAVPGRGLADGDARLSARDRDARDRLHRRGAGAGRPGPAAEPGAAPAAARHPARLADLAARPPVPTEAAAEPVHLPARRRLSRPVLVLRAVAAAGRRPELPAGRTGGARLCPARAALCPAAGHRGVVAGRHDDHAARCLRAGRGPPLRRTLLPRAAKELKPKP